MISISSDLGVAANGINFTSLVIFVSMKWSKCVVISYTRNYSELLLLSIYCSNDKAYDTNIESSTIHMSITYVNKVQVNTWSLTEVHVYCALGLRLWHSYRMRTRLGLQWLQVMWSSSDVRLCRVLFSLNKLRADDFSRSAVSQGGRHSIQFYCTLQPIRKTSCCCVKLKSTA